MSLYKKDNNHAAIAALFSSYGYTIIDTSWSRGKMLDFIAYRPHNGSDLWFVEVKSKYNKLTPDEEKFIAANKERSVVLHNKTETICFLAHVNARF
jgi:Holliday junction resolvase-like predicted endonuclease